MATKPTGSPDKLMQLIKERDWGSVQKLARAEVDLEQRDKLGRSLLFYALPEVFTAEVLDTLKVLVQCGINVNASLDADGCSALVTAVVSNLPDVVQLLIEAGVDVNQPAACKNSGYLCSDPTFTLDSSAVSSSASTRFIFSKGCGHTLTPLLCAVMLKRKIIFEKLLRAGASCKYPSNGTFWRASLLSVCSNCDIQITPLHMAAYQGELGMAYSLLTQKEEPTKQHEVESSQPSFNTISPLWFALLRGHEALVQLFLSLGKPIALACHFGSGLQVCLEEGHTQVALMILRAGYDLNDDFEWIQEQRFPTCCPEVIQAIQALLGQPRSLVDTCGICLRQEFGFNLNRYLSLAGAPSKVCDLLNFGEVSARSWQHDLGLPLE